MPRPRKPAAPGPSLNPGQAAYVIERLISERRVSAGDLNRYVSEMQREISDLEQRLSRLREAHGGTGSGGGAAAPVRRGPGRPAGSGRRPGRPAGGGEGAAGAAKRGPGRPAGSGKRRRGRPGRPPASAANAGGGAAAATAGNEGPQKRRGRKAGARKTSALSGEQLASRQLQGRYLALVRQFPEAKRAAFAKVAKERGREAAIRDMQESLRK